MSNRTRIRIILAFAILVLASIYLLFQIKFTFDFEQFFPDGDEDLAFFQEFIQEFETDDNFLMVGVRREAGVFDSSFLNKFHDFSLKSRDLPHVVRSQSLTMFEYPIKTPFSIITRPAIHLKQINRYEEDKKRVLADERFVHNLIAEDGKTLVIYLKTVESIQLQAADELMNALNDLIQSYDFEEYHYLGRAYFQREMIAMQKREIAMSTVVSAILVALIMFLLFRKPWGIGIALFSIVLGMILFLGFLGGAGRELNALSALYPVLMIIVGTSDVIHIMSKYIDELKKGKDRNSAIKTTIREIGLATLLTSLTTAVGFASLLSSRIYPIRDFGVNAAIGVIIAYLTVVIFTTAVLSWFRVDQIVRNKNKSSFLEKLMERTYQFTLDYPRQISIGAILFTFLCFYGISKVSTNYVIINNLPKGSKIREDFAFFDKELSGFRPMELAIFTQGDYTTNDFEVVQEIDKIETYLRQFTFIQGINALTVPYKSLHQMNKNNRMEAYRMPESEAQFAKYQRSLSQIPQMNVNILVNKAANKTRISSRIDDIGADSIKAFGIRMDHWVQHNIDSNIIKVRRTGTGVIIDKNAEYIRRNLLEGLAVAMLIVSLLMVAVFRNFKMLLISLIPNILPLLFAGALLGYLNFELEAGTAIIFAVIFGIAVDDTIHFLSKYKLALLQGLSREEALKLTFTETGKAIALTSIILFFGFLVMLFSVHPPSVIVGLLISVTLFTALIADLLLIPLLIRRLM